MNIFSHLSIIAFTAYTFFAIYSILLEPKSKLNQSFSQFMLTLMFWSYAYIFVLSAPSESEAMKWMLLASPGIVFLPSFLLKFTIVYVYKNKYHNKFLNFLIYYLPGILFLIKHYTTGVLTIEDLIKTEAGWYIEVAATDSLFLYLIIAYYFIYFFFIILILIKKYIKSKQHFEKIQSLILILSISIVFFVSMITENIIQMFNVYIFPPITPIYCLIFAFAILIAIFNLKFLQLTPEIAAEDIISKIDEYIILVNQSGKIISVNEKLLNTLGYKTKELTKKYFVDIISDPEVNTEKLKHYNFQEIKTINEVNLVCKNNEKIPIKLSFSLIEKNASLLGMVFVGHDLRNEKKLLQLENIKEISDMKSRFISRASHEFRTPLSTILLNIGTLQKHSDKLSNKKKNEYYNIIQQAINRMTDLLNDILLVEKSRAGKMEYHPSPFDLSHLLKDLVSQYKLNSDSKKKIVLSITDEFRNFSSDEKLVYNIFSNLISNAIKYTDSEGEITISLSKLNNEMIFKIKDNGIGIPNEDLPDLYESFHRGKNSEDISGTGLGLNIVKDSVTACGGKIFVDSEENIGTEFTVILPG